MKVYAEMPADRSKIVVRFGFNATLVELIREIPGRRFTNSDNDPRWTIPATITAARRLREQFGDSLELGPNVMAWGREEVQKERNLASLVTADDAELSTLPAHSPELAEFISSRPYQRADIAMMAATNVLNANQPGTGKTVEHIGSVIESGLVGPHLVIAPIRSLELVWKPEISRWSDAPIFTGETPALRKKAVAEGLALARAGKPCWILVNFDFVRLARAKEEGETRQLVKKDHKGNGYVAQDFLRAQMVEIEWATIVIDEFHRAGLNSSMSLFKLGVSALQSSKRCAMSGTPMGGKPIKLFPVLQWLEPNEYTSKWRWAEEWLEISDNGYGKDIGGIQLGREDAFYSAHAKHVVRRMKREALPGLPEKTFIVVPSKMTAKQAKQYKQFSDNAEITIDGDRLSGNNVLAEYTRLKQFANSAQDLREGVPFPNGDSGKIADLIDKLDEQGIRSEDPEPGARAIVASESKKMVECVAEILREKGIKVGLLTGDTKDSTEVVQRFEGDDAEPYVIAMTTQTGGVSLNLGSAGSIHALDEMWNPDDMEQLFDRGDRGSRTSSLICYIYRTVGTIQEYIAEVAGAKAVTNKNVLDVRRHMAKLAKEREG